MSKQMEWLYNPHAKPAKELSKHDQRMIHLGWDAHRTLRLDRPDREKIADIRFGKDDIQYFPDGIAYLSEKGMAKILALIEPLIEEAKREEGEKVLREARNKLVIALRTIPDLNNKALPLMLAVIRSMRQALRGEK